MKLRGVVVVEDAVPPSPSEGRITVPALEHVANRPILDHVVDAMQLAGVEEVIVAMPVAVAGRVRQSLDTRNDVAIRYLEHDGLFDLAAAIRGAGPLVGGAPCIIHRANGLLEEPLARFVNRLRDAPDALLVLHQGSTPHEQLSPAAQHMLRVAQFNSDHALGMTGVWLFGPGAMSIFDSSPWPPGGALDFTTLGKRIGAVGGAFHVELAEGWRQYRGRPLELLELNRIVLDRLDSGLRSPVANGNRIEGRVRIHAAASVRASVIIGPTVIGPGAQVTDSYIGPYTSIGERARVEGAEVERSIISPGASVQHLGGRLVASVVGRDARVFRDFSLPRALRLRVGDGTEVALC